jgi:S1-C subfamily serine protease
LPEGSHDLKEDEKKQLGLPATSIAIKVIWTNRGFQKGDVVVAVDERRIGMTTSDFIAYSVQQKRPKDKITLTLLRAGKELKLQVEAREAPIK